MMKWCRENIREVNFATNQLLPPLDFEANSFDWISCLSVFTHLSLEAHLQWITELIRITKPGGFILLTLHGDNFRSKLLPEETVRYEAGELVARGSVMEGKRMYTTFHPESFVRNTLLKDVEIVLHDTSPNRPIMGPQDLWLVRKPTGSP